MAGVLTISPGNGRQTLAARFILLCLALLLCIAPRQGLAQDVEAEPVAEAPANGGEEDTGTAQDGLVGSSLTDPYTSVAELSHLLVPLTREELEELGRAWLGIVRSKTQEIADLQAERVREPAGEDDPRIAEIVSLVEERARLLERYTLVLESLERKGGNADLVAELKDYRQSILFEETALASTRALVGSFIAWFGRADGGIAVLNRLLVALAALVAIVLVARIARGFGRIWIGRFTNISKLLQGFIVGALFWVFILIGLVVVLSSVDVDITPLFALLGGASFILAFAFQDTLGNLASGLMIMINQPFDEGDYIEVGGVGGTVKKVSIVGTTIATPDNRIIVVPNRNVWGNVIVNATASETRRVDLVFSASYDDPIKDVLEVIERVVAGHDKVLNEPAPDIRANELGTSSVNFVCRPWVRAADYWDVYCDLTRQVKEAFDEKGLSMPFQQQDIHIKSAPNGLNAASK